MGKTNQEKFMKMWGRERGRGKDRYVAYRTVLMGLAIMAGSAMGKMLSGEPFFLDYFMFLAGAIGGSLGSLIAWKRSEARYLSLIQEQPEAHGGSDGTDGNR